MPFTETEKNIADIALGRIRALEAEVARLRKVLERIAEENDNPNTGRRAREALEQKEGRPIRAP
jgi:hypothetical protein